MDHAETLLFDEGRSGTSAPIAGSASDFDRKIVCILGVPFDPLTVTEAMAELHAAAVNRRRCMLSTANLNFLVAAQRDVRFRETLLKSQLCLVDGAPIVWIARLLGLPLRQRAPGSSVFEAMMTADKRTKVFFFGGPDGVAQRAHERINSLDASIVSVGYLSPGFGSVADMSGEATIQSINAAQADFVVVALGAKKGQAWIDANAKRLNAPIVSHLGAVVNFSAGTVQRAPRWVQRIGFEWLWRIKEEPHLAGRYWEDARAVGRLALTHLLPLWMLQFRADGRSDALQAEHWEAAHQAHVDLTGSCTAPHLAGMRRAFRLAAETGLDVQVDMSRVDSIDAMGVGCLLHLYGHQLNALLALRLRGVSRAMARQLRLFGAGYLLDEDSVPCGPRHAERRAAESVSAWMQLRPLEQ